MALIATFPKMEIVITSEVIRQIVIDQLGSIPANDDSLSQLHQMDSLDEAEIILTVEDALCIELDLYFRFDTLFELIEAVKMAV